MIKIKSKGNFNKTDTFLNKTLRSNYLDILEKYGREGVSVLSAATPVDSGKTASSWSYKISHTKRGVSIEWNNSNIVNGANIAILIQYGHATQNGGFVQGRDFINPALQPVFDKISNDIWMEVIK